MKRQASAKAREQIVVAFIKLSNVHNVPLLRLPTGNRSLSLFRWLSQFWRKVFSHICRSIHPATITIYQPMGGVCWLLVIVARPQRVLDLVSPASTKSNWCAQLWCNAYETIL